jgi:REP element-mobilizing transposase RayT
VVHRIPGQSILPFSRSERIELQERDHAADEKVRRGPGRPPTKGGTGRVSHQSRTEIGANTAVLVTVRCRAGIPSLRSRRRFNLIKEAFAKFCAVPDTGFRLVHFAVLSNHVHFIVEADSARALSMGMKKVLHSISRRLNADSVFEHGGRVSTKGGSYKNLPGWLGRIFTDRFHTHVLTTPSAIEHAIRYVLSNSDHHQHLASPLPAKATTAARHIIPDAFTSVGATTEAANKASTTSPPPPLIAQPKGHLLRRACIAVLSSI